jgi:RimJ/RimL family protein N-acetyltransferase
MAVVELRRSVVEDAEAILAIRSDPITRRFQPMIPGSLAALRRTLAERGALPLDTSHEGKLQWTIAVDSRPAGWLSLDITSRAHAIANIGYALASELHGRGIVPAALAKLVLIAFDPEGLALERLEAVAAVDNVASRRVLEKSGFAFEGIARGYLIVAGERVDHARYGLLWSDIMP